MGGWSIRTSIFGGVMSLVAAGFALAQAPERPPVGGIGSPPDAMIFYVAHGAVGACGQGCSEWIVAEGTVQWDTHKRLINILDRQAGRKLPLVIHTWGESNLNVATGLGRILRGRGIDTMAGSTEADACHGKAEAECFGLKRPGGPLDVRLNPPDAAPCDLACVLILAGGLHRSLPAGTEVILSGMSIHNRLAPNVSKDEREGASTRFGELFRIYLRDMGVDTELLDIVDRNSEARRQTELPPAEWMRLRIVTALSQEDCACWTPTAEQVAAVEAKIESQPMPLGKLDRYARYYTGVIINGTERIHGKLVPLGSNDMPGIHIVAGEMQPLQGEGCMISAAPSSSNPSGGPRVFFNCARPGSWTPSATQIAELEDLLSRQTGRWWLDFARHYAGVTENDRQVVRGVLVRGSDRKPGIYIASEAELPLIVDGGCGVIHVTYYVSNKQIWSRCGGN